MAPHEECCSDHKENWSGLRRQGCGGIHALLGLIVGSFFSMFSLAGAALGGRGVAGSALFFGAGAVIVIPTVYGIIGFIGGIITAALCCVVASYSAALKSICSARPTINPTKTSVSHDVIQTIERKLKPECDAHVVKLPCEPDRPLALVALFSAINMPFHVLREGFFSEKLMTA